MGNSESSSQFPPPSNNNYGNNPTGRQPNRASEAEEEEEEKEEGWSALKIGAAVAGGALLALGAYSLASSSSSQTDDRDDAQKGESQLEGQGPSCSISRGGYKGGDHSYQITRNTVPYAVAGDVREMIKIMTYNVCSLEEFNIKKRMEAISDLIKKNSPDIILLQEMNPSIYSFFESCNWWESYKPSVKPEDATRKCFCMLLSKLPINRSYNMPLQNSSTGRGLCVISTETGRKLIAATCHLRRPDPPLNTYSEERLGHAKEALSFLNAFPNVVFGGDMNWNESFDGQFPVTGKWDDPWSSLKPDEDGYTYDTYSNGMLKHSTPVQGRLDRFICKLKDFKVHNIEMIGKEAIPGAHFVHNGEKLPIFPSDHYGLVLTICPK